MSEEARKGLASDGDDDVVFHRRSRTEASAAAEEEEAGFGLDRVVARMVPIGLRNAVSENIG